MIVFFLNISSLDHDDFRFKDGYGRLYLHNMMAWWEEVDMIDGLMERIQRNLFG